MERMFKHLEESFMQTSYDKQMGSRPTMDVLRNFSFPGGPKPMDLYMRAEQTFFDYLDSLLNPETYADTVYSLDEALQEVFLVIAKDVEERSNTLQSITTETERINTQKEIMVLQSVLNNKEA